MKFLVDMPLSQALASWLVGEGHDAIHALEIGLDCAPDEVIFECALKERRVIVTADLDYPRLLALARTKGPGLILFRGGSYKEKDVLERLGRVLEKVSEEELPRSIVVVEEKRIRRRYLPL